MKCGKPVEDETMHCLDCQNSKKYFLTGKSLWSHKGSVKDSIYRFKYKNRRVYAKIYGEMLAEVFNKDIKEWEVDAMVPVPIHKKRRKSRGYNQSELLANELEKRLDMRITIYENWVRRTKNTTNQKKLDNKKRSSNVKGAFLLSELKVKTPKTVLIIDDIYTTGATINAIAKLLVENGVENVYFITISIGQGF